MDNITMVQIVQSPHTKKPKVIFDMLQKQMAMLDYNFAEQKLDKSGIARLKKKMKMRGSKVKAK